MTVTKPTHETRRAIQRSSIPQGGGEDHALQPTFRLHHDRPIPATHSPSTPLVTVSSLDLLILEALNTAKATGASHVSAPTYKALPIHSIVDVTGRYVRVQDVYCNELCLLYEYFESGEKEEKNKGQRRVARLIRLLLGPCGRSGDRWGRGRRWGRRWARPGAGPGNWSPGLGRGHHSPLHCERLLRNT